MSTKRSYNLKDLERRFGRMTAGRFIRSFREADNISQAAYARRLGISRANLCDLEKGRKLMSPDRAARLAKLLGVPEMVLIQLALQDLLAASGLKYSIEVRAKAA